MDIAFDAIGLEVKNQRALHELAIDVGRRGEVSELRRNDVTLHGRCFKFGRGLEVWTMLYESEPGKIVFADCRPAFRSRFYHRISPWLLTEHSVEGVAGVHGFIDDTEFEVLFELQNLTEVAPGVLDQRVLTVGLCGLAYCAEISEEPIEQKWISADESTEGSGESDSDWLVSGRIVAFDSIRNASSGADLYWILAEVFGVRLEILVNPRVLKHDQVSVGSYISAHIWLQGHISARRGRGGYEGLDPAVDPSQFWSAFRRRN